MRSVAPCHLYWPMLPSLPTRLAQAALHYTTLIAWSFWIGGFSFYFGVVIRVGGRVFGDSSQGFVTQGVTWWLNIIAVIALSLFSIHIAIHRRIFLGLTWIIMVIAQGVLFVLHAQLDHRIDAATQSIRDPERFATLHEWYEFTSAIQWLAAMFFLAAFMWVSRYGSFVRPLIGRPQAAIDE